MTGMQWKAREGEDCAPGSSCAFTLAEGLSESRMDVYEQPGHGWTWAVALYQSERKHRAYGYGCATEGKARFMAMSLVSALLQIIDGVKPHEVD